MGKLDSRNVKYRERERLQRETSLYLSQPPLHAMLSRSPQRFQLQIESTTGDTDLIKKAVEIIRTSPILTQ